MKVNQIPSYKFNSKQCTNAYSRTTNSVLAQSMEQMKKNQDVSFTGTKGKVFVSLSTIGYAIAGFVAGGPIGAVVGAVVGGGAAELIKKVAEDGDSEDIDDSK